MAHSFDITTDSGLLALIDPDAYAAFVDPDWEFRHLMVHFREQMAKQRMLIWCAGLGAEWTVAVASESSPRRDFGKSPEPSWQPVDDSPWSAMKS
jgi:hypothetical protein